MSFYTPKQRIKEIEELIERWLANHQVTELVNTERVKLYRCQEPNTWVNGFDIILGPGCITVSGDIGEVLYTVGRGLKFLADYGCSSYGFEKLDGAYRDKKEVNDYELAEYLYSLIYGQLELENIDSVDFPKELIPPSDVNESKSEELRQAIEILFTDIVQKLYLDDEDDLPEWLQQIRANEEHVEIIYNLHERLRDHDYKPEEHELYHIIQDTNLDIIDPDWFEAGFLIAERRVVWVTACAQWAAGRFLEQQKEVA